MYVDRLHVRESERARTVDTRSVKTLPKDYSAKRALNVLDMQLCIRDAFALLRTSTRDAAMSIDISFVSRITEKFHLILFNSV